MLEAGYVLAESEQMYLDTKASSLEESQKVQFMIEILRQIDFMKSDHKVTPTIDTVQEFKELYEALKASDLDEVQSLQWRLEIMRHLSYSGVISN